MTSIKQLKDKDGNPIFPVTHTNAIFDSDGNRIEDRLSNMKINLDKTKNNKYVTQNQQKNFICEQEGYIDNIYLRGETLVNLMTMPGICNLTESNGNIWTTSDKGRAVSRSHSTWTYTTGSDGTYDDFGQVIEVKPSTTYTLFAKIVDCANIKVNLKVGQFSAFPTLNSDNANTDIWLGVIGQGAYAENDSRKFVFTTPANCVAISCGVQSSQASTTYKYANLMLLEGDYSNIDVPFFEGVCSIGGNNEINLLNYKTNLLDTSKLINATTSGSTGEVTVADNRVSLNIESRITIDPNKKICFCIGTEFVLAAIFFNDYDEAILDTGYKWSSYIGTYSADGTRCFEMYPPAGAAKVTFNIKNISASSFASSEINTFIITQEYDLKTIKTTLNSINDNLTDEIIKSNDKYIKIKKCGEVILDESVKSKIVLMTPGNAGSAVGLSDNTSIFYIPNMIPDAKVVSGDVFTNIINNRFNYVSNTIYANTNGVDREGIYYSSARNIWIRILNSRLSSIDVAGIVEWLKNYPIRFIYELQTPEIVEISDFNIRTFKDNNNFLIDVSQIKTEYNFEVTNSLGSTLDIVENKINHIEDRLGNEDVNYMSSKLSTVVNTVKDFAYNGTTKDSKGTNLHKSAPEYYFKNKTGCDLNTVFENVYTQTIGSQSLVNLPIGENGGYGIFECKVTYNGSALTHAVQKFYNTRFNIEYVRQYNFDQVKWTAWTVACGSCYINNMSFNDAIGDGHYYLTTCTDGPEGGTAGAWFLEVVTRRDGLYIYQRATKNVNTDEYLPKYERTYYNGTWTAWRYL